MMIVALALMAVMMFVGVAFGFEAQRRRLRDKEALIAANARPKRSASDLHERCLRRDAERRLRLFERDNRELRQALDEVDADRARILAVVRDVVDGQAVNETERATDGMRRVIAAKRERGDVQVPLVQLAGWELQLRAKVLGEGDGDGHA